jgi:hypothetical protein
MVGKGLQVLHDGSEVELVACTGVFFDRGATER